MATTTAKYPGSATSVTEGSWTGNTWVNPTNITAAGSVFSTITAPSYDAGVYSYKLRATNFDFSAIPANSQINGIIVIAGGVRYDAGTADIGLLQLVDNGTPIGDNKYATPAAVTGTASNYTKGTSTDLWNTSTLTAAKVKSSTFGVDFGMIARSANSDVSIDYITMEVYYTPPLTYSPTTETVSLTDSIQSKTVAKAPTTQLVSLADILVGRLNPSGASLITSGAYATTSAIGESTYNLSINLAPSDLLLIFVSTVSISQTVRITNISTGLEPQYSAGSTPTTWGFAIGSNGAAAGPKTSIQLVFGTESEGTFTQEGIVFGLTWIHYKNYELTTSDTFYQSSTSSSHVAPSLSYTSPAELLCVYSISDNATGGNISTATMSELQEAASSGGAASQPSVMLAREVLSGSGTTGTRTATTVGNTASSGFSLTVKPVGIADPYPHDHIDLTDAIQSIVSAKGLTHQADITDILTYVLEKQLTTESVSFTDQADKTSNLSLNELIGITEQTDKATNLGLTELIDLTEQPDKTTNLKLNELISITESPSTSFNKALLDQFFLTDVADPDLTSPPVTTITLRNVKGSNLTANEFDSNFTYLNTKLERSISTITTATALSPTTHTEYHITTLASDLIINAPSGEFSDGQTILLKIKDNGTSKNLSWNSAWKPIGLTLPIRTNADTWLYVGAIYNSISTTWDVIAASGLVETIAPTFAMIPRMNKRLVLRDTFDRPDGTLYDNAKYFRLKGNTGVGPVIYNGSIRQSTTDNTNSDYSGFIIPITLPAEVNFKLKFRNGSSIFTAKLINDNLMQGVSSQIDLYDNISTIQVDPLGEIPATADYIYNFNIKYNKNSYIYTINNKTFISRVIDGAGISEANYLLFWLLQPTGFSGFCEIQELTIYSSAPKPMPIPIKPIIASEEKNVVGISTSKTRAVWQPLAGQRVVLNQGNSMTRDLISTLKVWDIYNYQKTNYNLVPGVRTYAKYDVSWGDPYYWRKMTPRGIGLMMPYPYFKSVPSPQNYIPSKLNTAITFASMHAPSTGNYIYGGGYNGPYVGDPNEDYHAYFQKIYNSNYMEFVYMNTGGSPITVEMPIDVVNLTTNPHLYVATFKSGEQTVWANKTIIANESNSYATADTSIGGYGSFDITDSGSLYVNFIAAWRRKLSDEEIKELYVNPWQIYTIEKPRFYSFKHNT